jgi:hypothetical protein
MGLPRLVATILTAVTYAAAASTGRCHALLQRSFMHGHNKLWLLCWMHVSFVLICTAGAVSTPSS